MINLFFFVQIQKSMSNKSTIYYLGGFGIFTIGGYYLYKYIRGHEKEPPLTPPISPSLTNPDKYENTQFYSNKDYIFDFHYPNDFEIKEIPSDNHFCIVISSESII